MLPPGEVELELVDLGTADVLSEESLAALARDLDDEERTRAARLRFAADRARFVVAHAALRACLARRLTTSPRDLRFRQGPWGKPALSSDHPPAGAALHFNMSHSRTVALIAVAGAAVGVDVEDIAAGVDELAVAARVFSERERRALEVSPAGVERSALFYALWTRKEALLKAMGTGFSREPATIDLGLTLEGPGPWRWAGDAAAGRGWSIGDIELDSRHRAAVALEGRAFASFPPRVR